MQEYVIVWIVELISKIHLQLSCVHIFLRFPFQKKSSMVFQSKYKELAAFLQGRDFFILFSSFSMNCDYFTVPELCIIMFSNHSHNSCKHSSNFFRYLSLTLNSFLYKMKATHIAVSNELTFSKKSFFAPILLKLYLIG